MKTFVQHGNTLALIAPYAVASGAPFKVGAIVAIAINAAAQGGEVVGMRKGVFVVPKLIGPGNAWNVGDKIYFAPSQQNSMTTVEAPDGVLVGVAVEVAAHDASTGTVLLDGAVR